MHKNAQQNEIFQDTYNRQPKGTPITPKTQSPCKTPPSPYHLEKQSISSAPPTTLHNLSNTPLDTKPQIIRPITITITITQYAGIYRETITVAVERNQNSTNKPISPDLLLRLLLARKGDFLAGGGNTEEEG
ncbi:hypothetical protein F9C07_513 [Aspergillus flavus]|uniref:Uncharacterized protein n=2 Tax=Aspergillus subgen. Circumdati TaxID=2720871 RepID=A0A7U2MPK5_ASPFN|nr:unnamed protein product [Aspergillus oryzae RIB40]QRD87531.1 hypothetical protein F9C07_513 [Aspergillus flavus]BAE55543.1 unnamed protein product [Aspergillus oryzae RIB40]